MSIAVSAPPRPEFVAGAYRALAARLCGLNSNGPRAVAIASAVLVLGGAAVGAAMPVLQAPVSVAGLKLSLGSAEIAAAAPSPTRALRSTHGLAAACAGPDGPRFASCV